MNKEEFLKAIENVPKTDSINPTSAYNSINVEDLANAVDRFKKVPTYDELLKENQKYKEVIDKVRNIAYEYGQIDGAHHKTWVIDQIIRELLGTEYDNFIKEYEEDGEYTWDIGIVP